MLRPATPLTILLFVALVLLVLSVISTPLVKSIPLGTYAGVNFGVFGYCKGTTCSPIELGYDTSSLFTTEQSASFNLASSTRSTLSRILIVHPIAALFTLIMLICAASAHFHSPSHSPRYLLCVFLLSIITLLITLLAFLIDVLLFVPHMAWGSYIVLAATVLIACSGIVSCAMRRTIVSKKAQKRRIEENAEMNGENFYNRQNAQAANMGPAAPPLLIQDPNKLPAFATFEETSNKEASRRTSSDDRVPLTARSFSNGTERGETRDGGIPLQDRYGVPTPAPGSMPNGRLNGSPPRDQYGNILPPVPNNFNRNRDQSQDSQFRNQYPGPNGSYRGGAAPPGGFRGRGGPNNMRGRSGPQFAGRGRGGYGPPPSRGAYGQNMNGMSPGPMNGGRGGMGPGTMMRGGRGAAMPTYQNGYGAPPSRGGPPNGQYQAFNRPSNDGQRPNIDPAFAVSAPPADYAAYDGQDRQLSSRDSLPRAESPPPLPEDMGTVGQAVEMDATTGSPSQPPPNFTSFDAMRRNNENMPESKPIQSIARQETFTSNTSRYSNEEPYVPPRSAWGNEPRTGSPMNGGLVSPATPTHARNQSQDYYEDVDPRFAEVAELPVDTHPIQTITRNLPPVNNGGSQAGMDRYQNRSPNAFLRPERNNNLHPISIPSNHSFEDIHSGSRSPAESERSTFTSVSQRGINPRWTPQLGDGMPPMQRRQPGPSRNDVLLDSNPDFNLPGMGTRGGRGGMRGMQRGGGGAFPPPSNLVSRSPYDGAAL